jgi:NADPH:quinone reductase-like Zn-dependent oxidoreductase
LAVAVPKAGAVAARAPQATIPISTVPTNATKERRTFTFAKETREELAALRDMIESGQIRPIVARVLPASRAAEAHRLVETEERRGAIVLRIGDASR